MIARRVVLLAAALLVAGCADRPTAVPTRARVVLTADALANVYGADDATRAGGVLTFGGDGQGLAHLFAALPVPPGAVLERVELRVFASDDDGATGQTWIAADVVALEADDRLSSVGAGAVSQREGEWETLEAVLPADAPAGPLGLYVTTLGSGASARYGYGIAWIALTYRR